MDFGPYKKLRTCLPQNCQKLSPSSGFQKINNRQEPPIAQQKDTKEKQKILKRYPKNRDLYH
jgi:hypothetical protein